MQNQKPCAVQKIETSQGFSVSYNGQFLYSKYNPSKNVIAAIENLQLLPGTIILCCSPLLGYGLFELCSRLPENCLIILCEADKELYATIRKQNVLVIDDVTTSGSTLNEILRSLRIVNDDNNITIFSLIGRKDLMAESL